jgi:hypothetical protein
MDFKHWYVEQGSEEWEKARTGITASMVSEFYDLGFESWKNLMHPEGKIKKTNEAMEWGRSCEDPAVESFLFYHKYYFAVTPGLLTKNWKDGQVGASLDRVLYDTRDGSLVNLEVKCPHPLFSQLPKVPKARVIIQTLTQMFVSGIHHSFILYWQPKGFVVFEYFFNSAVWEEIQKDIPEFQKILSAKPKRNPFKARGLEILKILEKLQIKLIEWEEVPLHIASDVKANKKLKM